MRRIRFSFLRPLSCVLATFAAVAGNSVAHAACNSGVFGYTNTCFGTNVLLSNEIGAYNTGFGYEVLYSNINGYNNTAIGFAALRANTSGGGNTASGWVALNANTTGIYNTASGSLALAYSTTGSYNTASGMAALHKNTTGSYNTATGSYVLYSNTTGSGNTATGDNALFSSTSGQQNTANGGGALKNATTGYRNVALGYQAGLAVTTGSDNIIIGAGNSGLAANGVIRIGTSAYQKRAFIAGIRSVTTGVADAVPVLIDSKGQLGTIKSSRRFKDDIQPMGSVSERLFSLRPVTFRYKQAYEDGSKPVQYGLVAEEVAEVLPELVVYGKDGKPETVAYHVLATLLLNELQKEHRVVEALRQDNEAQLARMAALERQNAELAALKAQVAILAQAVERADKSRMVASTR